MRYVVKSGDEYVVSIRLEGEDARNGLCVDFTYDRAHAFRFDSKRAAIEAMRAVNIDRDESIPEPARIVRLI